MKTKKTFERAKEEILEKFNYLSLLEFNGNNNIAKFLDSEYGEFEANYKNVLRGHKSHPERSKKSRAKKFKKTSLERFGVENPFQNEEIKEKIKQNNIEKHGVEHYVQTNDFKNKALKTLNNNYGVDSPLKSTEIKEKIRQTNLEKYGVENVSQNENIKDKKKITCLNNYGEDNFSKTQEFKDIIKKVSIEKYGTDHFLKSNYIREKIVNSIKEKYGVDNVFQSEEIKEKIKETNLERYGFASASKNKYIKQKVKNTNLEKYGNEIFTKSDYHKQNMINNNFWHNIDGYTLAEYYRNSELSNIRSYTCIQQNYNKCGNDALLEDFYDMLASSSISEYLWISELQKENPNILINQVLNVNGRIFKPDGFDPTTNTVYEYNGNYFHGNPDIYDPNELNVVVGKTFGELYNKTIDKENYLKNNGYIVISVWG